MSQFAIFFLIFWFICIAGCVAIFIDLFFYLIGVKIGKPSEEVWLLACISLVPHACFASLAGLVHISPLSCIS
jgi:hypothetical protein